MDKSVPGGAMNSTVTKREGESLQGTDIYFFHIYGLIVKEAEHLKIQLKWIELKVLPKNLIFIYMLTVDWRERKVEAEKYRQRETWAWEESELYEVKCGLLFHVLRDQRNSLFVWVESFMQVFERNGLLSWTKVSARDMSGQPSLCDFYSLCQGSGYSSIIGGGRHCINVRTLSY